MPLLEWFANNYKNFGATLEIVTDRSQEGAQFVKGFGGIGGKFNLYGNWKLKFKVKDSKVCCVMVLALGFCEKMRQVDSSYFRFVWKI